MDKVLNFINRFKRMNPAVLEEVFTRGSCYWFAVILRKRFKIGEIWYHPVDNHFAYRLEEKMYDITGEIMSDGFIPWAAFCHYEPIEAKRIRRSCIRLEVPD